MRLGTLGAARITPAALLQPAAEVAGVEVVAVAARDPDRARAYAEDHQIPVVWRSYEELLADDSLDAIYNPLPASAHAEWTIRALEAGKHVLCEKPLAMNAGEAAEMAAAAERSGRVLMEALHWRYHPMAARLLELVPALGQLERAEAAFLVRLRDEGDIRYQLALGGGATMDLGCYALHWLRCAAGEEPRVLEAAAVESPPGVDASMDARLAFPGGLEGRLRLSFQWEAEAAIHLTLEGTGGRLRAERLMAPQRGNRLTAELADGRSVDEEATHRASYTFQLEAFVAAVEEGRPPLVSLADSVANMAAVDAVYRAAGLPLR